ncbi:hypothetical protein [Absidia glauca]|uniref:Uncharacterized protein n=1 Tax=Absidia glauca TaxID=4829 RepID=A0A163IVM5_ABSGL|nr:hypothetical protein [Absidia glauca]
MGDLKQCSSRHLRRRHRYRCRHRRGQTKVERKRKKNAKKGSLTVCSSSLAFCRARRVCSAVVMSMERKKSDEEAKREAKE